MRTLKNEVELLIEKLNNDDITLLSFESSEENELIHMCNIIEDQKNNLVNFQPDIDLSDTQLNFQTRETSYERFEQILGQSYNFMSEVLRTENGSPLKFNNILEKERYWNCPTCSKKLLNN